MPTAANGALMMSFTAKDAKNRLGEVFRMALAEPVLITNHGKPVVRVISALHDPIPENAQDRLDRVKHQLSCEVLSRFPVVEIKRRSLENLARWRSQGVWNLAYEQWTQILENPDDHALISYMVGMDERSNQLRQSMPYVGLVDQVTVRRIREKA
jgi:prevent-host-death family protein